mmetsp:Transcript_15507/g.42061  ORF Transcript_15507/g.42061 Transcript_15507/m.42061 type:complete len:147 (+) Transcript_15507:23-463(+)
MSIPTFIPEDNCEESEMASKRPLLVAFAAMIAALAAIQIISMGKVRKNELIGFAAEPVMFSPVMLNRIYSDVDYKSDPPLSPCAYLSEGVYYEHSYIYPRGQLRRVRNGIQASASGCVCSDDRGARRHSDYFHGESPKERVDRFCS